jgi:hypothetical protein
VKNSSHDEPLSSIDAFIVDRSLYVDVPDEMQSNIHIELFDLLGRKVAEWNALNPSGHRIQVYLPVLPSGMYLVRASDGVEVRSAKVVKAGP